MTPQAPVPPETNASSAGASFRTVVNIAEAALKGLCLVGCAPRLVTATVRILPAVVVA